MKKVFLLTVSFMLFSDIMFAQENNRDIVYLKNGSVIKGQIIEQVPNKTMTIQTSDGSTFVCSINDVKKIAKESALIKKIEKTEKNKSSKKNRFSYCSFNVGGVCGIEGNEKGLGLTLNLVELNIASNNGWGGTFKWGANGFSNVGIGYLFIGPSYSLNHTGRTGTIRFLWGRGVFSTMGNYGQRYNLGAEYAIDLGYTTRFFTQKRFNMTMATDFYLIDPDRVYLNLTIGFAYSW